MTSPSLRRRHQNGVKGFSSPSCASGFMVSGSRIRHPGAGLIKMVVICYSSDGPAFSPAAVAPGRLMCALNSGVPSGSVKVS
ncbi:Uncharacterised protein [Shigella sonnei]|nr:Uncharacterised protein [Shigella sonnei]